MNFKVTYPGQVRDVTLVYPEFLQVLDKETKEITQMAFILIHC